MSKIFCYKIHHLTFANTIMLRLFFKTFGDIYGRICQIVQMILHVLLFTTTFGCVWYSSRSQWRNQGGLVGATAPLSR
jgi:hypothetical protein